MKRVLFIFVMCVVGTLCTTAVQFDGLALLLMKDFDMKDVQTSYLSKRYSDLTEMLKSKVNKFRNASPDPTATFASYLTGRYPAYLSITGKDNTIPSLGDERDRVTLFALLRRQGYQVGHFGEWPFSDPLDALVDRSYISYKADDVASAAIQWIQQVKQQKPKQKFFLSILWPKVDLTFNLGGSYDASDYPKGVIQIKESALCKDVKRIKSQSSRYKTCARLIYLVNRRRDFNLINNVIKELLRVQNTFVGFTTVSGNESPLVDGHAFGRTMHRGLKRSLYEGGIRTVFHIGHNSPKLRATLNTPASLNSVDILPTLAKFAGIKPSFLHGVIDGIDMLPHLLSAQRFAREQKQVWEYRYNVPGHCREEAPRFAIVDDIGRFKLLVEPGETWQSPPVRKELYDLQWGTYELTNWANASLSSAHTQGNLVKVRDYLFDQLKQWMRTVMESPGYTKEAQPHYGCEQIYPRDKAGGAVPSNAHEDSPMGIVIILADDAGVSDVAHGQRKRTYPMNVDFEPHSPGLDSLADEGLVMGHFYSSSSVCSPTRASVLTGRYPSHRLVRMHAALLPSKNNGNGVVDFLGSGVKNLTVMSKLFQRNGWRTGHFGKWHLGFEGKRPDNPLYGIDEIQTYAASFTQNDYKPHAYATASKQHPRAFNNFDIEFPARSSQVIVDRTIEFIRDRVNREEKFLVNVWLQNAHAPLNLYLDASEAESQAAENGYASSKNPFPGKGRDVTDLKLKEYLPDQIYRILFREQDRAIKRLVDFIDGAGIGSKTLIIYTSDNGPETEGVYFVGRGSATPYRGKKRSLYEGGIRAPGIVRWKDHIKPGAVMLEPATTMDLYPTLVSLAKLDKSLASDYSTVQGRDLSCSWLGTCGAGEKRALIFEWRLSYMDDCLARSARFSVRYGNYKLHYQPKPGKRVSKAYTRAELYDVIEDPMESTNLLVTRSGDPGMKALMNEIVDELRAYTQSTEYDVSKFPSSTRTNGDPVFSNFVVGQLCKTSDKIDVTRKRFFILDAVVKAITGTSS